MSQPNEYADNMPNQHQIIPCKIVLIIISFFVYFHFVLLSIWFRFFSLFISCTMHSCRIIIVKYFQQCNNTSQTHPMFIGHSYHSMIHSILWLANDLNTVRLVVFWICFTQNTCHVLCIRCRELHPKFNYYRILKCWISISNLFQWQRNSFLL